MLKNESRIRLSYLIIFTLKDLALALGLTAGNRTFWRWTSRFCGSTPNSCSLGQPEADRLIQQSGNLLHRYRGARLAGVSLEPSIGAMFWLFADAIERCLDLHDQDCVCSWTRRMTDAEELTTFMLDAARAYWSTGAESHWMGEELERLACLATDVFERDGLFTRLAADDLSVEARADRLAICLFDGANDLWCDNWANEAWMSAPCAA